MINTRIGPLIRKEFIHIRRDPRSLMILFIMPLLMMFIFGYAINMDLKHIRIAVCDLNGTPSSRELIENLRLSSYFKVVGYFDNPNEAESYFTKRLARAVIIIPQDFDRQYINTPSSNIGVITDGSDANSATLVQNYVNGLFMEKSLSFANHGAGPPVTIAARMLYNPDMISSHFIVPGIAAVLLIMIGALLTSVTIAREKETGTMEQILVSPIRPYEVVLGKAIPYLVLSFMISVFILVFGHLWFNVPMLGNWGFLFLFCVFYIFTALAIGLLISTIVGTQQVAMMLSMVLTMLPSVMLSGFVFPIASMPKPLQIVSQVIPATHFLKIIRGVMLKGNGPLELFPAVLAMSAVGFFFIFLAVRQFKLKLS